MFKPEKMLSTSILLLEDDVNSISRLLAAQACFHLTDQRLVLANETLQKRNQDSELADQCRRYANLADVLLKRIDLHAVKISPAQKAKILSQDSGKLLEQSETVLTLIQKEIESFIQTRNELQSQIARLESISQEMYLLDEYHLSFEDITRFQHFFLEYGIIDKDSLDLLRQKIAGYTCHMLVNPITNKQLSLLLIGDKDHSNEFRESLVEAGFHHHDIPEKYRKSINQSLDIIEAELWQLRDSLAEQNGVFIRNRDRWQAELSYWERAFTIHGHILKAMEKFGYDGPVNLITGFVPESKHKTLVANLEENARERYFLTSVAAEQTPEVIVPTRLKNLSFFRPFEMFIETYGLPGYKDIDPTPIVGLSFLLMFGMMFGDVGHGAVLAIFGLLVTFLPYQVFAPMRTLGKILSYAGASGMIFGFLFGSFFGIEDDSFLPALWMRPRHQENLTIFLAVALGIGVTIITLGIILNIIQMIKKRKIRQALLGEWSVASLSFYWMLLILMVLYANGKSVPLPTALLGGIITLPILLIVITQIVYHYIDASKEKTNEEEESDLATIFFEPIEIIMNLFTNTVSFLRVAAFGLAHAALMMATFIIKDMIPSAGANFISLPMEHLFIIVLEGMIVTIQCLRLEYYEFFSKFFNGDGIKYSPLTAENN